MTKQKITIPKGWKKRRTRDSINKAKDSEAIWL